MSPVPAQITDHVDEAKGDLLSQFQDKARIVKFTEIVATQYQMVEDWFYELATERTLDAAIGAQLDLLGKVVGGIARWRWGLSDDDYRKLISVAIRINNSNADAEDTTEIIAELVGATVRYIQMQPATYRAEWLRATRNTDAWLSQVVAQMPRIVASGVAWELVEGVTGAFRFDSGPGFDQGKLAKRVDTL